MAGKPQASEVGCRSRRHDGRSVWMHVQCLSVRLSNHEASPISPGVLPPESPQELPTQWAKARHCYGGSPGPVPSSMWRLNSDPRGVPGEGWRTSENRTFGGAGIAELRISIQILLTRRTQSDVTSFASPPLAALPSPCLQGPRPPT